MSESANLQKGMNALFSGDTDTALRELRPLAKQGNAVAQFGLGVIYNEGRKGVKKNYIRAHMWWSKAVKIDTRK